MYKIISKYKGGEFEIIDTANSLDEANVMVQEYEMAFGNDFRVEFARVQFLESALRPYITQFPTYIRLIKENRYDKQ